jgi:polysaccharide pyruvyl transferase CsaB
MSHRVIISGYYGFDNAGDEAILAGLAAGLRQLAPGLTPVALSADPARTAMQHGLDAVPRANLGAVWRALRSADLLLSGGGGLFQDSTSWRTPVYYAGVIRLARAAGCPVMVCAQGIGPLRGWLGRRMARGGLNRAAAITVRDEASAEMVRALGVRRPAEVTADASYLLDPPPRDDAAAERTLLVCLRGDVGDADFAGRVIAGLGRAVRELGLDAVIAAMQPARDRPLSRRLAGEVPRARELDAPDRPADLLARFGGVGMVLSMRLHGLIFAHLAGAVPVGISYDPKVDAFLAGLGLRSLGRPDEVTAESLSRALTTAWNDRASMRARLQEMLPGRREAARRNIELAGEIAARAIGGL